MHQALRMEDRVPDLVADRKAGAAGVTPLKVLIGGVGEDDGDRLVGLTVMDVGLTGIMAAVR